MAVISDEIERISGYPAADFVQGADPGGGSGLRGLRDRIDALDGTISVSSEAGRGTTLSVRIPLGSADDPGR